ncbi:pseudaminic acid biosynthesis-associated methylase [Acetobacterium malicum]|uniref:Pseudaminic acid biosynthesis-associated methylase n=1 Tax=Acetobacterium malicum TaxID=52692 RepID=A0ABR6YV44_9FIRM|nr:pseudaminic acid biosynthesis-associated methylase [Acetobacterium malicum]MBC3899066.1 pseudaminic acid biosynthesis-associated methylase [Acetobacterium malicum]
MIKEKTKIETEQEAFWKGSFGDSYIERNDSKELFGNKIAFYAEIVKKMDTEVKTCIEFGSNIGLNLMAISALLPNCELSAVEINKKAIEILKSNSKIISYEKSILDFKPDYQRNLVITHGVMIHLNPDRIREVYQTLFETSNKFILISEYYNPVPVEIEYRGFQNKLFKRDFAGDMLDLFPDLKLVDYGFVYHRDKQFPLDDLTWFLLKK